MSEPTLKEVVKMLQVLTDLVQSTQAPAPAMPTAAVETRPLTARELAVRWGIDAEKDPHALTYLARRCYRLGLVRLEGGNGWGAVYALTDVLKAEAVAAGQVKRRRKPAGKKRGVLNH